MHMEKPNWSCDTEHILTDDIWIRPNYRLPQNACILSAISHTEGSDTVRLLLSDEDGKPIVVAGQFDIMYRYINPGSAEAEPGPPFPVFHIRHSPKSA